MGISVGAKSSMKGCTHPQIAVISDATENSTPLLLLNVSSTARTDVFLWSEVLQKAAPRTEVGCRRKYTEKGPHSTYLLPWGLGRKLQVDLKKKNTSVSHKKKKQKVPQKKKKKKKKKK